MKKITFIMFGFLILWLNFMFSQEPYDQNTQDTETVTLTKTEESKSLRWNLKVFFCDPANPTTTLPEPVQLQFWQLEEWEICLRLENYSDEDAKVELSFVDSVINDAGSNSCGLNWDKVAKFITPSREWDVKVPAKNHVIKTSKVQFPLGIQWNIDACMIYVASNDVLEAKASGWAWFIVWVETRLAKTLSFFVWDAGDISTEIIVKDIKTELNELNQLVLWLDLYNSGNVNSSFTVNGKVTNMFWFESTFMITWGEISSNQMTTTIATLGEIPSYKWLYSIDFEIESKPKFSFNINDFEMDDSQLKKTITKAHTSFFEIPRMIIWVWVVVIFLLFIAFRKKKPQVVYVQQPTAQ